MTSGSPLPDAADSHAAASDPLERREALEAVAASVGATLQSSHLVRVEAAGETFTTGHDVAMRMPSGAVERHTIFLDGRGVDRPGVLGLRSDDGEDLAAWVYPADPELPALAAAAFPAGAAALLQRFGFEAASGGSDEDHRTPFTLDALAYRPAKRAVLRVQTERSTVYLKVVRPSAVSELVTKHRLWRAAGIPVPEVIAWSPEGLMALEPLPGVEASTLLGSGELTDSREFAEALAELRERMSSVESSGPARASLSSRLRWYLRRLHQLAPNDGGRIDELGRGIRSLLDAGGEAPGHATVHGDLHLGQLFVDPARASSIVGVLDIDTAGFGDPADDSAALWGHLIATALMADRAGREDIAGHAQTLAETARRDWEHPADRGRHARTAAIASTHLIGHALSGTCTPAEALSAAETLVADEKALTAISFRPHAR